jgi:predicted GNAT family acetyltransferase
MRSYRRMSEAGLGHWYGAFSENQLVADLGLFHDGALGRFQNVGTHPAFRRRGVCATLVFLASQHALGEHALGEHALKTLVMVADEDGDARRVYEDVGFVATEKQRTLSWWSK